MKSIFMLATIATITFISCDKLKNSKTESDTIQSTVVSNVILDTTFVNEVSFEKFEEQPPKPPGQTQDDPSQIKGKQPLSKESESKIDWNKKIIKTADLNMETKSYQEFSKKISEAANRFGGYIAEEQQTLNEYKVENTLTIRVPVDQFQSAVDFLTTGDGVINEKKITSEDVTTQYVDTRSRLEAKRMARMRYLDLLKQAKNMAEVLQVQTEVDAIQEEIESAAGRINYLTNASAMSTIHITYYQVLNVAAKNNEDPGFFKQVGNAFATGWEGFGKVIIGLIYIWPFILIIAGLIWYLKRVVFSGNTKVSVGKEQ